MQRPKVMIASIGVAVVAAAGGITAAVVSTSSASAAPAAGHGQGLPVTRRSRSRQPAGVRSMTSW